MQAVTNNSHPIRVYSLIERRVIKLEVLACRKQPLNVFFKQCLLKDWLLFDIVQNWMKKKETKRDGEYTVKCLESTTEGLEYFLITP